MTGILAENEIVLGPRLGELARRQVDEPELEAKVKVRGFKCLARCRNTNALGTSPRS